MKKAVLNVKSVEHRLELRPAGNITYIDDSYNSVFEQKYAAINPRLISQGLYLVMESSKGIKENDYGNPDKLNYILKSY